MGLFIYSSGYKKECVEVQLNGVAILVEFSWLLCTAVAHTGQAVSAFSLFQFVL